MLPLDIMFCPYCFRKYTGEKTCPTCGCFLYPERATIDLSVIGKLSNVNYVQSLKLARSKQSTNRRNYQLSRTMFQKIACVACESVENLTVHHFVPTSKGGLDVKENRMILCFSCHNKVHNFIRFQLL